MIFTATFPFFVHLPLYNHRKLDKEQQEKYQQELEEMRRRLEGRPLLMERVSLDGARSSAEAKYTAALKKAGLSDDEIRGLSSEASGGVEQT